MRLGKLGMNKNFRQFLGVICAKNLRESDISSPSWGGGAPSINNTFFELDINKKSLNEDDMSEHFYVLFSIYDILSI